MIAGFISGIVGVITLYITYRMRKQDRTLNKIEINVNSRLSRIDAIASELAAMVNVSRQTGEPVPDQINTYQIIDGSVVKSEEAVRGDT